MPKTGLTDREWRVRLTNYASGTFSFGRGQKPRQNSRWARVLNTIDTCPQHGSTVSHDPFGRPVACSCGYHEQSGRSAEDPPRPSVEVTAPACSPAKVAASPVAREETSTITHLKELSSSFVGQVGDLSADVTAETEPEDIATTAPDVDTLLKTVGGTGGVAQPPSATVTAEKKEKQPVASSSHTMPRHTTDYSSRLPQGWIQTLSPCDQKWIGRALFVSKGNMNPRLQNWWFPPQPKFDSAPSLDGYFAKKLFLWMPRKMWLVDFHCPRCGSHESLRSKGVYHQVRMVLNVSGMYYLAAEYMDCRACNGTYIAWDYRMLDQLSEGVRARFPAVLTRKYACDWSVIGLLRSRTLGNSPTALRNTLKELHSQEHLTKVVQYLSDCDRHRKSAVQMSLPVPQFAPLPEFPGFRTAKWFLAAYVRDVWSRLPTLKAMLTSVFGRILKIDSTKKVCRKLQGSGVHSAGWATSMSNEKGEILMCVLTESEGTLGLKRMADGIMDRYSKADKPQPVIIYTDRDCCTSDGPSKIGRLFNRWEDLPCRLDVWHFMRRLAKGVTSESHPLYGTFMSRLSGCIFEWDVADYQLLLSAKRSQLVVMGIPSPTDAAVKKAVSKEEMALHCRRRTRGTEATVRAIEALLLSLSTVTDSLGVPLLNKDVTAIWEEQQRHVSCLQDPPDVQLYTVTGRLKKGHVILPVLRCARGTTSLESFHLHLARFIPGTSAGGVNFQAYLLDGLARWNTSRSEEALEISDPGTLTSYDIRLKHSTNGLCRTLELPPLFPSFREPMAYTGELIGVEYLFAQANDTLSVSNLECDIDEGFVGVDDEVDDCTLQQENMTPIDVPCAEDSDESTTDQDIVMRHQAELDFDLDEDEAVDFNGIPGWKKVDQLAEALINLPGLAVTNAEAYNIKLLYDALPDFDKKPISFKMRTFQKKSPGFFGRSKGNRSDHLGVDMMKRCFLSGGSPASTPSKSRLVEAICIRLTDKYTQPYTEVGADGRSQYVSRWRQVLERYNQIRARVNNSQRLLEGTNLALFTINEATVTRWYKNTERRKEIQLLIQGVSLPTTKLCSSGDLPRVQHKPKLPTDLPQPHFSFRESKDTSGQATVRQRHLPPTSPESDLPSDDGDAVDDEVLPVATVSRTTEWRNRSSGSETLAPDGTKPVSRTTEWRRRKAGVDVAGLGTVKVRKIRCCTSCNLPIGSAGHSQFRGKIYCPFQPGQVGKQEWLALEKEKVKNKSKPD